MFCLLSLHANREKRRPLLKTLALLCVAATDPANPRLPDVIVIASPVQVNATISDPISARPDAA